jgi:hypothetical protein
VSKIWSSFNVVRGIVENISDEWQVVEGVSWIDVPGFGRINPRRDNEGGGRQYFDAMTDGGEYGKAMGTTISGGPETWHFEFDDPFWLADGRDCVLEVSISLVSGGRYGVRYRPGVWPSEAAGGWSMND